MRISHMLILCFIFLGLSLYKPTQAQETVSCPSFVQSSLQQLGNNCANSLPGSACFGSPGITTSYTKTNSSPAFSKPGDRINLSLLSSIQTSAINLKNGKWGISLLNTQANLPKVMNSKGVVMVTLGDVRVEDAVLPENALKLPEKSISVQAGFKGADLFNIPFGFKTASVPFGHIAAATTLQADGISSDGKWLRVYAMHDEQYFQSPNAWVKISELSSTPNLKGLPTIEPDSFTSMQSFYLNTGLEQAACDTAPTSMLYLQGPEETEVQLRINGEDISFGSTILVRTLPPGNMLQVIVLSGITILNRGTSNQLVLPPGFASQICLSEPSSNGNRTRGINCAWSAPTLLSFDVLEALYTALDGKIPQNLQYYRTYVPRLVCPSGVGHVRCRIRLAYGRLITYLNNLCQRGLLPKNICDQYILT